MRSIDTHSIKLQQETTLQMKCILCWPQWANIGNNMYLHHCNVFIIYTVFAWCLDLRKCQYSLPIQFVLFLDSVMNKFLNNKIYRICFSFCFFSETPPFPNVNDLYKQFTSRDLLPENVWYIQYINAILKWMGVDMNECIQANSKNWVLDWYWSVLYSSRIQPRTDTHTILPDTVPVLGCNGLHRVCIGSVLYTGWRYKNGIAQYRVSTVGIERYRFCISFFYCIPKTCTNTVLSSTVFTPAIRYPVSVYGTGWYRNDVQNGTVW